jgi:O-antigen/teichoic acid export membrane protein
VETLFLVYFLFSFLQGLFLLVWSRRLYPRPRTTRQPATGPGATQPDPTIPATTPSDPIPPALPMPQQQARLTEIFRFSSGAFIVNFLFFSGMRICLYFMPWWVQPADLGNYIQAYKIVEYLAAFIAFVYYPFMTLVAARRTEKTEAMVLFLVRLSNTVVLAAVIFFLAFGWSLFPFVFGKSFNQMYAVFIWLIPGAFAACSSSFFTAYYFGKGSLKINFISCCIQFGSLLLFFFLFIKTWGVTGAAIAFSLSSLLSLLYDCWVFKRFSAYRLGELLLVGKPDLERIMLFLRETWTPVRRP